MRDALRKEIILVKKVAKLPKKRPGRYRSMGLPPVSDTNAGRVIGGQI
jgi:hypothetical protein